MQIFKFKKIIKTIWIWIKLDQRHLVLGNWSFSCQFVKPRPSFFPDKIQKIRKTPKIHEKWRISQNLLFKYRLFPLKLYIIRRRIACRIFWVSVHVCNTFSYLDIDEKPVDEIVDEILAT